MLKFMRLLHPYFRPYQSIFWLGFIFLLIGDGLTYVIPYGIRVIWDQVFPQVSATGGIAQLAGWCGLLVLVAGARAAILYGYIYLFWLSSARFMNDFRNRLYQKLQRLPFRETPRTIGPTGALCQVIPVPTADWLKDLTKLKKKQVNLSVSLLLSVFMLAL